MDAEKRKKIAQATLSRRHHIQQTALRILAAGGVIAAGILAPNILGVLAKEDPAFKKKKAAYRRVQETLWRMERNTLIQRTQTGKGISAYTLTQKGEQTIDAILSRAYQIKAPLIWDGKWRIVMFDIPERKRLARVQLRTLLRSAGFVRLQDSVWVYPHPCDDFVMLLRAHLKSAHGEMHYVTADFAGPDTFLRKYFNLH